MAVNLQQAGQPLDLPPRYSFSPTVQRIVFVIERSQWQKQGFRYLAGSRTILLLCTGGAHPGPAGTERGPEAER